MHTASDFTVPPPATNPVAQRDATLAVLADIKQRLDRADETLTRLESAAAPASPRAAFHPSNHAAPVGYSSCGHPVEVTVDGLTVEAKVYLHGVHDNTPVSTRRPVLVVVGQAWTDDHAPVMNTAEWAVYTASHPGLAEDIYEAITDKWAGYAEQAHERAMGGR